MNIPSPAQYAACESLPPSKSATIFETGNISRTHENVAFT